MHFRHVLFAKRRLLPFAFHTIPKACPGSHCKGVQGRVPTAKGVTRPEVVPARG